MAKAKLPKALAAVRALNSVLPKPTLAQRLATLSTFQLKDVLRGLMTRTEPGANDAFAAALAALEKRISEKEFVAFCDKLGAAK